MKKALLLVLVSLIFTACGNSVGDRQGERFIKNLASAGTEGQVSVDAPEGVTNDLSGMEDLSGEVDPSTFAECYPESIHPIGMSIAEQFSNVTTYQEVMSWFCDGAEFEDILNALITEELSDIQAQNLLEKIATGYSWDDIWLELGITEQ